ERSAAVMLCSLHLYPECLPILLKMGDDKDRTVRRYLGAALGAYGDARAVPVLRKLLRDPDSDHFIKIWAADGLGQLGRKDGIPILIDLLRRDETQSYRGNITTVLEQLTRQKLREDAAAWQAWWQREGQSKYGAQKK
ncbi:MAG: HEAT repeat domain-containing protein, partial [Armatimonadota bacterium]|nr:HEAT repeat domain-containing protein [Armatimonadota bacterium]